MLVNIRHRTEYEYTGPTRESYNELRLYPHTDAIQTLQEFHLRIDPPAPVFGYEEPGGHVHHFAIRHPHAHLTVEIQAKVETRLANPYALLNLLTPDMDFYQSPGTRQAYAEYLSHGELVPELPEVRALAQRLIDPQLPASQNLLGLMRYVHDHLEYDTDATHVQSTIADVLAKRAGVCQDFAHITLALCRAAGIPARYVSGYLCTTGNPELRGEQATHAWVEALLPTGAGPEGNWLGMDATNNVLSDVHYVKVHVGRDYDDCPPTKGIYVGYATSRLDVEVEVKEMAAQQQQ